MGGVCFSLGGFEGEGEGVGFGCGLGVEGVGFCVGGLEGEGVGFGCGCGLGTEGVGFSFGGLEEEGVGFGDGFGFSDGGLGCDGVEGWPHCALLQSTGLLMTALQVLASFCFGLSGMQLLLSSNLMSFPGGTQPSSSPLK